MIEYLLKSGACMAIFILFYKLFLEQESFHTLKRYYLLLALVLPFVIPLIVFTSYVQVEPVHHTILATENGATYNGNTITPLKKHNYTSYIPYLLYIIYVVGFLITGFRFIKNLRSIFLKINKNPKLKEQHIFKVLLLDRIVPHTFFNYIFLNKKQYTAGKIPEAVLLHEKTHAKQKHSFDVLFVELLQVIFWFNPLIYLTKKQIKLNHEFLADQAVVKQGIDISTYQSLLLTYSTKAMAPHLSNSINYSSIKKRFTIMKKQTSKNAILLRSLLLLPLFALLFYSFSSKKIIKKTSQATVVNNKNIKTDTINSFDTVLVIIKNENEIWINNEQIPVENLSAKISNSFKNNEDKTKLKVQFHSTGVLYSTFVEKIKKEVKKAGVYKIQVFTEAYIMPEKEFTKEVPITPETVILKTNKLTTVKQTDQEGATKKQIAEYNTLAKNYNTMLSKNNSVQIKLKDVNHLEYLYGLMTAQQKESAEPFPSFPEPPLAPMVKKGEKSDIPAPLIAPHVKKREISNIPPPPSLQNNSTSNNVVPPAPPTPPNPVDLIIDMAKKGATFTYNGKNISSDQALELVKNHKNLNINCNINEKTKKVKITD